MQALTQVHPVFHGGLKSWAPFTLENRLRRFFGPELLPELVEEPFAWTPDIDFVDMDKEFVLMAELPGMKREDVEIDVMDDRITVKGEKKQLEAWKEANVKVAERMYGMFERTFTLPAHVEVDKIHAELQNGLLAVHLPKAAEARGRRIEIEPR